MSHVVPTVRIVNPIVPDEFIIINASDVCDHHELWDDAPVGDDFRVGKGPRGKWYVKLGKESVAGPFETEAEAEAERGRSGA